jgi:predicted NBD/HSP70 family sugar kinase
VSETQRTTIAGASGASELFQLLRDGRPRTRAELAEMAGLARSTVGLRVDELLQLGLIGPVGEAVSSGGRPPSQFALNPGARLVLAVDCGASHQTVVLSDLSSTILASDLQQRPISDGPERVLEHVVETARALLTSLGRSEADLIAVGIGLPGPVEHATGRAVRPPIMPGWDDFDVPGWVMSKLGIPALVDNDVNIMAIGERTLAFPQVEDLLFVKVATGIGSGIISGGMLQRGAQGTAGDLGHIRVSRGDGVVCDCGNIGCLEAMASGPAIARQLRERGVEAHTARDVIDLVSLGNEQAIAAVHQAGRDIGEVLTTCVSLINPSVIVIGGSMAEAGEHLIAGIHDVVYARAMPIATSSLSIVLSAAGESAGVIGASVLASEHALSPQGVDALLAAS